MAGIPTAEAARLANAWLGKVTYPATVTPVRLRLTTTDGTASTAGTEVVNSGGSAYASQDLSVALPASTSTATITNNAVVTFTNMPAVTVVAVEVFDSAATPVRKAFGGLASDKTTALGDSISFAAGALSLACSL